MEDEGTPPRWKLKRRGMSYQCGDIHSVLFFSSPRSCSNKVCVPECFRLRQTGYNGGEKEGIFQTDNQ